MITLQEQIELITKKVEKTQLDVNETNDKIDPISVDLEGVSQEQNALMLAIVDMFEMQVSDQIKESTEQGQMEEAVSETNKLSDDESSNENTSMGLTAEELALLQGAMDSGELQLP